jgi:hypothetical protein
MSMRVMHCSWVLSSRLALPVRRGMQVGEQGLLRTGPV